MHFFAGKFVFASLICNFRHGREEDEVMGVSFHKDLVIDRVQIYPPPKDQSDKKDKLQAINYNLLIKIKLIYLIN